MRALITGGAGFIGSHLADGLLAAGHEVNILDDLSTGAIENVDPLIGKAGFRYWIDSVMNEPLLAELVDRADVVFHLAAAVGVQLIVDRPTHTIETNVGGTEAVLRQAAKKKKKVVIASTSEVYGKSMDLPFREDADLVLGATSRHRWAYACSKMLDEFLGLATHREKGVPVVVVRLFNTIGPRQTGRYGMVVPRFVEQALRGEPITIYGDGRQSRSFTWVGDVVRALTLLATEPRAVGEVFNVGHGAEITIAELAEEIRRLTGSTSPLIRVPYERAYGPGFEDMPRRVPDLTKIRRLIGYVPSVALPGMLQAIIDDARLRHGLEASDPALHFAAAGG